MAFDCVVRRVRLEDAPQLSRDAIAALALDHGLAPVYVVASVEIVRRRWRLKWVDVIVHMDHGDDILGTQFPDEAAAAVRGAVDALLRAPHAVAHDSPAAEPRASARVTARPSGVTPRAS